MRPSVLQQLETDPEVAARRLLRKVQNRDGLPEMYIGAVLIATALLIGLQVTSVPGTSAHQLSFWGMVLLIAPMIGVAPWAIKWTRRRFLIETVGFVELKPVPAKLLVLVTCLAFLVAAAMVWAVYRHAMPPNGWRIAGTAIAWGSLAAYAGRLPRFIVGGVLMSVAGICLAFCNVSFEMGSLILYGSMGILSLVSGCVVFLRLVRTQNQEAD